MIELFNGHKIDADSRTFILLKERKSKKGETVDNTLGYYPTIQQVLQAVYKFESRGLTEQNNTTIEELVQELNMVADKVSKSAEKIGRMRFCEVNQND